MSQTVTQQRMEIVKAPRFGVIDPTTGHMMHPDDAALHCTIGPDQGDPPPGASPPRGPPFGGAPGGGGPPFGGHPGGGGGGGGPPHGHPGVGGPIPQNNNSKLIGNPPIVFNGERDKAEAFLTQWDFFIGINLSTEVMHDYYQRSMLFLSYIQGKLVSEWVCSMSAWLTTQVVDMGVQTRDRWLWDSCLLSFNRQFADTLQKEKSRMTLRQGIRMQEQDLDGYIAHFEELVRHAGYDINGPQTIDMFTRGLPTSLYETIYQHDQPETFEQWRRAALRRQGHWYHLNARKNLDKFKTS